MPVSTLKVFSFPETVHLILHKHVKGQQIVIDGSIVINNPVHSKELMIGIMPHIPKQIFCDDKELVSGKDYHIKIHDSLPQYFMEADLHAFKMS